MIQASKPLQAGAFEDDCVAGFGGGISGGEARSECAAVGDGNGPEDSEYAKVETKARNA